MRTDFQSDSLFNRSALFYALNNNKTHFESPYEK